MLDTKASVCIVAVGYNRPWAMARLLNSLARANYEGNTVDLKISIDRGTRQQEIIAIAESFVWEYGNKEIRAFPERQGLRSHILQCGDYVYGYDAVVVLEDDVTVSESFYTYVKQSTAFYRSDPKIAGISLYKHHINICADRFFEPEYNGFDTYLMQFAQSWGECWTKDMWSKFRQWYAQNETVVFAEDSSLLKHIPNKMLLWGNQSWMKYFMAYVLQQDLYFVYPYHALSTNHAEIGQHNSVTSGGYQVAMATGFQKYRFPDFEEAVKYDIFFERMAYPVSGYGDKQVALDLYGNKKAFEGFDVLISSAARPYKVLETWKLKYRPQEVNCRYPEPGVGLFVYDLHQPAQAPKALSVNIRTRYDTRVMSIRNLLMRGLENAWSAAAIRIKKIF